MPKRKNTDAPLFSSRSYPMRCTAMLRSARGVCFRRRSAAHTHEQHLETIPKGSHHYFIVLTHDSNTHSSDKLFLY